MSCNLIKMENGHKVAHPITSREEYRQLRGSEVQMKNLRLAREGDESAKKRLVQFNYSLVASQGEDSFLLKGAKATGNSVAMDIDHLDDEALKAAISRVLELKVELGLMMMERSARGQGLHVVFRRHNDMTNEENLRWASDLLGVEFDSAAKDITRVFFATGNEPDDLLYLDDELFESPPSQPSPKGEGVDTTAAETAATSDTAASDAAASDAAAAETAASDAVTADTTAADTVALEKNRRAFDLCVKEAGLSAEVMDVWGEHNWHTNLMAVLSVGLPKLMSREQLVAVVREKLPNYGVTEDCGKLINYFYENYTADMGFMSVTLRDINARAQREADGEKSYSLEAHQASQSNGENGENGENGGSSEDDRALDVIMDGWEPPVLPKRLPRLVELEVRNYDYKYREALAQTAAVGHSALASHYRARYLNNKIVTPATMVSVIGGSGSGKDFCTQLFNDQMRGTLEEAERQEWEKVRVNSELREKMRNAKECPPKYHPKIRIFEGASKTSLLELQTNLGENGMLVGLFTETDGFVGASAAAWSNLSVMLRKGFSGERHRQFYMSDATCNTSTALNISLLMEGTPKAMLERMFNDKNCENGTMQRFAPVLMPKMKRTFRPPKQYFLSDDEMRERDALLMELYQKDLALGDDTLIIDTTRTNRAIGQWFDSLEERYNDGLLTDAEADLSHRCGEFILKTALPLIALYGETKEVVDYAVWVGEMAFYNMCRIYGHRVQEYIQASNELLSARMDARRTAEPLLSRMPEVFNVGQFKEVRVRNGQSEDVKMLLSRYCRSGKLERIGRGVYRKCKDAEKGNIVTVTKIGDPV